MKVELEIFKLKEVDGYLLKGNTFSVVIKPATEYDDIFQIIDEQIKKNNDKIFN